MSDKIEVFEAMLASDPENTPVLFGLANEYMKAGLHEKAIETLNRYLSAADDEGAAHGMLARAYEAVGDREKARSAYLEGIETALANDHPTMAAEYRETLENEYSE